MIRDRVGAVSLAAIGLLLAVFGAYRIAPVDVPWHLETGRLALQTGSLPVTNTFSWTYPDFPLSQQYPLYQLPLAWLVDHVGFEAFGLLNLTLWWLAGLAWLRAAGSFRDAARQPMLWLLVAIGLQRHHVARPEVWTVLGMGLVLWGLTAWAAHRRPWPLVGVVLAQWAMVNGHQLWMFGLGVQGAFLFHLAASRWSFARGAGIEPSAADLPLGPPIAALAASVLVLPFSPLGLEVYLTPLNVFGTLLHQGAATSGGAHAKELQPVWSDPLAAALYLIDLAVVASSAWRSRRSWSVFEFLVVAATFAMASMAVRGIHFFTLAAGWQAARVQRRVAPMLPEESPVHAIAAVCAGLFSTSLAWQLSTAEPSYLSRQAGLGRSRGEWADETLRFLLEDPPPGRMMNLSWVAGNAVVGGWRSRPLFVDPRFESYPREFLLETIAAKEDDAALSRLLETWHPTFLVLEMRDAKLQRRAAELVATGEWSLAHVDSILCVVVHHTPETAAWLAAHPTSLDELEVRDWVGSETPVLLAEQQVRVARLYRAFRRDDLAAPLIAAANARADHPVVASELATVSEQR